MSGDSIPEFSEGAPKEPSTLDFASFAKDNGYLEESIDPINRFAIKVSDSERYKSKTRTYFAQDPSGNFSPVAEGRISPPFFEFSKYGRKIPGGSGFYVEEESLKFMGEQDWGYETLYVLNHLKGQVDFGGRINNVGVRFDKDGNFWMLDLEVHDGSVITSSGVINVELDKHFDNNQSPLVRKLSGGTTVICEKGKGEYVFYLIAPDGKPAHKVIVRYKIDIESLMDELDVKKLIEDPLQPADGIKGKSLGDKIWRNENFGNLVDVSVTPIDKPDEEEFDRKGFRDLIESVRKEI